MINSKKLKAIAARAIIMNENNAILMVSQSGQNWHLPGGWIDDLEPVKEACKREVMEETGINARVLHAIYILEMINTVANSYGNILHKFDIFFLCSKINSRDIDSEWQDIDNNAIQHRRFFNTSSWQNDKSLFAPSCLKSIPLTKLHAMPNIMNQIYID